MDKKGTEIEELSKIIDCKNGTILTLKTEVEKLRKENEEWHIKYAGCNTANNGLQELYTELKAENEKLTHALNEYRKKFKEVYLKYSQCLKEIKEIVSEPCIDGENCDSCNSNCMQKDILKLIDEVIGAE